jgi:ElaB/YqjD/DUF883 family membrane-anchored ribosome-binding protein
LDTTIRGNSPMPNGDDGKLSKASSSAHAAVDSIAGAVDKAAGAAAPTADWLAEQGESLKATQKKLIDDTCSYVSANPLKAVAIAVVTGFVLSRFIR